MKSICYDSYSADTVERQLLDIHEQLSAERNRIKIACNDGYDTPYSFVKLCFDRVMHEHIEHIVIQKKMLQARLLIVIGIGGSHLGIQAVYEALYRYNDHDRLLDVCFIDTLDSHQIRYIQYKMTIILQNSQDVVLVVISKSGTTLETVVNMQFFVSILQQYRQQSASYIIAITDENSPLYKQAHLNGWTVLTIPKTVGGRYSIFSAVGLFPLSLLGVDITQLCAGAQQSLQDQISEKVDLNFASIGSAMQINHYRNGRIIHDLFLFCKRLQGFGLWWRQLIAESLGKESYSHHKIGIVPTISIGSSDLHSMAQLYLGGPSDVRFTTIITVGQEPELYVQHQQKNSRISDIMFAIVQGITYAYKKKQLPFAHVYIPKIDAYQLGYLMQWQMIQTIYMAHLLQVNPFDQPHVELYKSATRKILYE